MCSVRGVVFVCSFSVALCGHELKEQCYEHVCIPHFGKILYILEWRKEWNEREDVCEHLCIALKSGLQWLHALY